jgi:glycine betaine/proline transport system ATP-binding protein
MANIKIKISNLYKVFGDDPKGAMEHVRKGATKQSLLDDHRHVLGLRDINIDIPEKKIQVVMGLSGSGKSTLIRHINRLIEPTEGQVIVDGVPEICSVAAPHGCSERRLWPDHSGHSRR